MSHATPPSGSRSTTAATVALIALVIALAVGAVWWAQDRESSGSDGGSGDTRGGAPTSDQGGGRDGSADADDGDEDGGRGDGSDADPGLGEAAEDIAGSAPDDPRVVVISVDGLGSTWVSQETTPTLARLLSNGAGTLNARTERELTLTLPNHTGMVTGRRVAAARGGHGVTWNKTDPRSVRPGVESVFSVISDAGGSAGVFAGKAKFEMWGRAWPGDIDELVIEESQPALVDAAVADVVRGTHDLTFLHLAGPDSAGHKQGWGSEQYLRAVRKADAGIATLVKGIAADPEADENVVLVVTADHGGQPGNDEHGNRRLPTNYTVPFLVWGPGVTPGDLYALNPDYRDPGARQPSYAGPQPVRNGAVANVVTDLLGLDPVPGSEFDAEHDLDMDGS